MVERPPRDTKIGGSNVLETQMFLFAFSSFFQRSPEPNATRLDLARKCLVAAFQWWPPRTRPRRSVTTVASNLVRDRRMTPPTLLPLRSLAYEPLTSCLRGRSVTSEVKYDLGFQLIDLDSLCSDLRLANLASIRLSRHKISAHESLLTKYSKKVNHPCPSNLIFMIH